MIFIAQMDFKNYNLTIYISVEAFLNLKYEISQYYYHVSSSLSNNAIPTQ